MLQKWVTLVRLLMQWAHSRSREQRSNRIRCTLWSPSSSNGEYTLPLKSKLRWANLSSSKQPSWRRWTCATTVNSLIKRPTLTMALDTILLSLHPTHCSTFTRNRSRDSCKSESFRQATRQISTWRHHRSSSHRKRHSKRWKVWPYVKWITSRSF